MEQSRNDAAVSGKSDARYYSAAACPLNYSEEPARRKDPDDQLEAGSFARQRLSSGAAATPAPCQICPSGSSLCRRRCRGRRSPGRSPRQSACRSQPASRPAPGRLPARVFWAGYPWRASSRPLPAVYRDRALCAVSAPEEDRLAALRSHRRAYAGAGRRCAHRPVARGSRSDQRQEEALPRPAPSRSGHGSRHDPLRRQ